MDNRTDAATGGMDQPLTSSDHLGDRDGEMGGSSQIVQESGGEAADRTKKRLFCLSPPLNLSNHFSLIPLLLPFGGDATGGLLDLGLKSSPITFPGPHQHRA